jgi:hypothetical protein
VPVIGGTFSGPKLKGQVLSGGGDWLLFRKDGAAQLDVRSTLRTEDGALIYVSYRGISIIPPDTRARIMEGRVLILRLITFDRLPISKLPLRNMPGSIRSSQLA